MKQFRTLDLEPRTPNAFAARIAVIRGLMFSPNHHG
jgi:hypothetical protein